MRRRGKSNGKSRLRAPVLRSPPELALQNRYEPLFRNERSVNEPRDTNYSTCIGARQNPRNSPKTTNSTGERRNFANFTADKINTILIGDDITKQIRMAKTENLSMADTSVRELTEMLPIILSAYPSNICMSIIIHTGSFDILQRKTGSEILKKDFSMLLKEITKLQRQVFISGPIPTVGKGIESFSRLLGLNTWLASACLYHGIRFIDNFNIFWNCKDRFRSDGVHPNITGCRLLGANICNDIGKLFPNKLSMKDSTHTASFFPKHSFIRELALTKESRAQLSLCPTSPHCSKRALRQLPQPQPSCPLIPQSTKSTK